MPATCSSRRWPAVSCTSIGATTLDEYRRNIEKDAALERRFQPILVPEPSVEDTVEILRGLRDRYEAHHQVRFTDEALVAAAELSDRYIDRPVPAGQGDRPDRPGRRPGAAAQPDGGHGRRAAWSSELEQLGREKDQAVADEQYERATELRDQIAGCASGSRSADAGGESRVPEVTAEDIAEVVSRATGIPVSAADRGGEGAAAAAWRSGCTSG